MQVETRSRSVAAPRFVFVYGSAHTRALAGSARVVPMSFREREAACYTCTWCDLLSKSCRCDGNLKDFFSGYLKLERLKIYEA